MTELKEELSRANWHSSQTVFIAHSNRLFLLVAELPNTTAPASPAMSLVFASIKPTQNKTNTLASKTGQQQQQILFSGGLAWDGQPPRRRQSHLAQTKSIAHKLKVSRLRGIPARIGE